MRNYLISAIVLLVYTTVINAQDNTFPFLDTKAMGAYDFIKQNPEADGRNVVIFILDNSVDPSIPGMIKTSTGKPKVIDMQDYSGQLEFNLKEAEYVKNNNVEYLSADGIMISGYENLKYKPEDGKYHYGIIDENKNFKNSPVKDLNSNSRSNDKFAIVAFKITMTDELIKSFKGIIKPELNSKQWVYYVDEDGDGHIDEETPRFTYKYNLDYFNFYNGEKGKRPLVVMSANIHPDSKKVTINTCDGSHGTHCGGIACGYEIYNAQGNNGIAPGAYIVSIKIGSNLLSGGATTTEAKKKAYQYGVQFLKESGIKYGVFSMSYGIGSEQPGTSEIEKFLNKFTLDNPNIIVVTSNGNNGPGLNSTGNPAGAENILSVGAMLPVDVLKNLYGSQRNKPWITNFSSRGGESNKPDVIAPGGASSSVPAFEKGDAFWGTSMSCPQVAGAAALLFSAAEHNNLQVDGAMIKKALKYTASLLPDYSYADQGFGLVNIPAAFLHLKSLSQRKEYDKAAGYEIRTDNSFYSNKKGNTAFWKSGGYYPAGSEKQNVNVRAVFYDKLPAETKHNFYRAFVLSSDSPWLRTDKDEIYIRGENSASFSLIFDSTKIKKPGLYSGRIVAKPKGEAGNNIGEFEVYANIVIPYNFTQENLYKQVFKNERINVGDVRRIYIEPPIGASSAFISISPVEGKPFNIISYLFKPDGKNFKTQASTDENLRKDIIFQIPTNELQYGIWELMPSTNYLSLNDSYCDITVQFFMFDSEPKVINKLNIENGEKPKGDFRLINLSQNLFMYDLKGSILGYEKSEKVAHQGSSIYKRKIKISSEISKYNIKIEMSDDDFNKNTDLAFNIYDNTGKSVFSDGMSRKSDSFTFIPNGAGEYTLELEAGFTHSKFENQDWNLIIRERYFYKSKNDMKFQKNDNKLTPKVWNKISFSLSEQLIVCPDGFEQFGEIEVIDLQTQRTAYSIDLLIK